MSRHPKIEEPLKALNAVCPYYTMFPLDFPLRTLAGRARKGDWVADPFCGRGTTNFAARLLGLPSVGVDSSPVAVALTQAKLADARAADVVRVAAGILREMPRHVEVPTGEFWKLAYQKEVLRSLCWLRESLLRDCNSDSRLILRAILLARCTDRARRAYRPISRISAHAHTDRSPITPSGSGASGT